MGQMKRHWEELQAMADAIPEQDDSTKAYTEYTEAMQHCFEAPSLYEALRIDEFEDNVNHPKHYTDHPSGVECIQITEYMNFCLGNAMKYIWRAGLKQDRLEDLKKAVWYLNREIARHETKAVD